MDLIETERLSLRPFRLGDVVAAHTWFRDPIVMRYTPTGPDSSVEKTRDRLARTAATRCRRRDRNAARRTRPVRWWWVCCWALAGAPPKH